MQTETITYTRKKRGGTKQEKVTPIVVEQAPPAPKDGYPEVMLILFGLAIAVPLLMFWQFTMIAIGITALVGAFRLYRKNSLVINYYK